MVARPSDYPWSSFNLRTGAGGEAWLDPIPGLEAESGATAQRAHAALVESSAPDGEWRVIRSAVARGQLTGDQGFVDRVHRLTGRRIEHRGRGRPPRRR
jgi:putative transposase